MSLTFNTHVTVPQYKDEDLKLSHSQNEHLASDDVSLNRCKSVGVDRSIENPLGRHWEASGKPPQCIGKVGPGIGKH